MCSRTETVHLYTQLTGRVDKNRILQTNVSVEVTFPIMSKISRNIST